MRRGESSAHGAALRLKWLACFPGRSLHLRRAAGSTGLVAAILHTDWLILTELGIVTSLIGSSRCWRWRTEVACATLTRRGRYLAHRLGGKALGVVLLARCCSLLTRILIAGVARAHTTAQVGCCSPAVG